MKLTAFPKRHFKTFLDTKTVSQFLKKVFEPLRGFLEKCLCNCASYTFTNASS